MVVALFHDAEPSIGLGGLALVSVPASWITGLARVSLSALPLLDVLRMWSAKRYSGHRQELLSFCLLQEQGNVQQWAFNQRSR